MSKFLLRFLFFRYFLSKTPQNCLFWPKTFFHKKCPHKNSKENLFFYNLSPFIWRQNQHYRIKIGETVSNWKHYFLKILLWKYFIFNWFAHGQCLSDWADSGVKWKLNICSFLSEHPNFFQCFCFLDIFGPKYPEIAYFHPKQFSTENVPREIMDINQKSTIFQLLFATRTSSVALKLAEL